MYDFWLEVSGDFDSRSLWKEIERYEVNLLDFETVYIFGRASLINMAQVLSICCKYGSVKGDFKRREI